MSSPTPVRGRAPRVALLARYEHESRSLAALDDGGRSAALGARRQQREARLHRRTHRPRDLGLDELAAVGGREDGRGARSAVARASR